MWREEQIGDCRLILADCREVLPTLGPVDAVVTDPPFGMSFQSNYRAQQHEKIENDGDETLLAWACEIPVQHSRYVFCRWDNLPSVAKPKSCITWVKNNWSMGDLEHEHGRQTEICLYYPGPNHFWPSKRPNDVIECTRTGNNLHPTEKPLGLMEVIVGWTSGVVFDPFMGSGTTGNACVTTGRAFIGCEIHEPYFDIACRRIEAAYKQPRLFAEPVAKPVQESLL
jgi:site-specific DNA-methyltransferase (adenine-specific)